MPIPTLTLAGDVAIPQLGFGTYKIPAEDAEAAVSDALELGYRHIDTAAMYGNEVGVGKALASSGLARDELFVTSKLDNPYHEPAAAKDAFARSLDDLGLDVLDLYLIHWPLPLTTDYAATWQALVDILGTGRVRAIGVSNFQPDHLRRIIDATGVTPAVNQVEVNPYLTQQPLRALHEQLGIVTEAWSPLARGRLLDDPALVEIAERVGRTVSQVVLRWHLQRGDVVFPKSTHRDRMAENADLFTFELRPDDMDAITGLNRDERSGSSPDVVELKG
ncbi:aldo/keto reductase [Nigerium massiliense]